MSEVKSMADRLEERFNGMDIQSLEKIMPFFVEYAQEMREDEPELFGDKTVKQLAINAFFDNLHDGSKDDAIEDLSAMLLNALEVNA